MRLNTGLLEKSIKYDRFISMLAGFFILYTTVLLTERILWSEYKCEHVCICKSEIVFFTIYIYMQFSIFQNMFPL